MPTQFHEMSYQNHKFGFQPPQVAPKDVSSYPNGYANPMPQFLSMSTLPVPEALPINSQDNIIRTIPPPGLHTDPLNHVSHLEDANSQTFNMQVQYKGTKIKNPQSLISDLSEIGEKINRINELSGTDIGDCI